MCIESVIKRHASLGAVILAGLLLTSFVSIAHSEQTLLTPPANAIIKIPLDHLDPPRGVPAKDWKSAYCASWDDGCTHCTRSEKDGPATCVASQQAGACKRHAVVCFGEIDNDYFLRVCKSPAIEYYWKTKDGRIVVEQFWDQVWWVSEDKGVMPIEKSLGATSDPHVELLIGDSTDFFLNGDAYDGRKPPRWTGPAFGAHVHGRRCLETYNQK